MEQFEPLPGGGAAIGLDRTEAAILRSLAEQLLDLLGDAPATDDPLAAALGLGPTEAPADPVLARLLPDAYDGRAEASAEFRRFTEHDLRARKRDDAKALLAALDRLEPALGAHDRVELLLDADECRQWLTALNDLRLAIATRLGIAEEGDAERLYELPATDPRTATVIVYSWLNLLQDSLVESLASDL